MSRGGVTVVYCHYRVLPAANPTPASHSGKSLGMVFIGCWHVLAALLLLPVRCSTQIRTLPNGPLILGYATHCGEDRIIREAREGVNVIIWFSTNLKSDANGHPSISFGNPFVSHCCLNATCIASVARELMKEGLETSHLVSIGGWDAPHPDTNFTAKAWWDYWKMWNKARMPAHYPANVDQINTCISGGYIASRGRVRGFRWDRLGFGGQ
eukprot:530798-Amorphochlora_amoeboformis.AAC.1